MLYNLFLYLIIFFVIYYIFCNAIYKRNEKHINNNMSFSFYPYFKYLPDAISDVKMPLVWGFTIGYKWEKMSIFVSSLRKNGYNSDLVMAISTNMYKYLHDKIEEYNILPILIENDWPFYSSHNQKYPINITFLKNCIIEIRSFGKYKWMIYRHSIFLCWLLVYGKNYTHIISLDVRDVVFQGNPFHWNFEDGLYVVEEIKRNDFFIKDNIYNFNWIKAYKNYNKIKSNKIINAGTIIGSKNHFISFIYQFCQFVKENKIITTDQGIINYAYYTGYFKNIKFFMNQNQRGIVITTHLDLPEVIKLKRVNSTIFNEDGTIPLIVHQYDRCKIFTYMYKTKYCI